MQPNQSLVGMRSHCSHSYYIPWSGTIPQKPPNPQQVMINVPLSQSNAITLIQMPIDTQHYTIHPVPP